MRAIIDWLEERFNITEMFSFLTSFGLFPVEVDASRPVGEAIHDALRRPRPSYTQWSRVLGVLAMVLFLFLAITGVMLAFYYRPAPAEAYESVTSIVRDVSFGWFVHQVHGWAAHALLLVLLIRGWQFFFQGIYKRPREALWIIALLLLLLAIHADMTGRLLAWDAGGYWSTVRALEILYSLPVLGPLFRFLVGGAALDALVLTRFYLLHILVIPGLFLGLLYLNFSGVRRVGLPPQPGGTHGGVALYRVYLYNLLILVVLIFGALVTLATLAASPFEPVADPYSTPVGVRPPWYLLASHGFMESFPAIVPRWLRGLCVEMILTFCLLVPFIDRSRGIAAGERRWAIAVGLAVLLLWLFFSWVGHRLEAPP